VAGEDHYRKKRLPAVAMVLIVAAIFLVGTYFGQKAGNTSPAGQPFSIVYDPAASYVTAVIREAGGKQGPGADYPDAVNLPYGRLISIIGQLDGGGEWLLATLVPEMDAQGGVKEPQAEAQQKFWVHYDAVEPRTQNRISFDEAFPVMDIGEYRYVALGDPADQGRLWLRQAPDEKSPYAALTRDGSLLSVIRKDSEWSLVKKFNGNTMIEYTQVGWIKNDTYTEYKPGMTLSQGFVLRATPMYEAPDAASKRYPPQNLQNTVLPVNILKNENGWTYISSGFNGLALWVETAAVRYSFTPDELFRLAYPDIDKDKFLQAMKTDLKIWPDITLRQDDTGKKLTLSAEQKAALAEKLTDIRDVALSEGNVTPAREALFPGYRLDLPGKAANVFPENSAYGFVVAGEDKLLVLIPYAKMSAYGLNPNNISVRFIRVNQEFVAYLTGLLPAAANNDPQNLNYLFRANKVVIQDTTGWISDQTGLSVQQVNKCVRVIKAHAGKEATGFFLSGGGQENLRFTFRFADGSEKSVRITDRYLAYDGKYFELAGYNGEPREILTELFAAYF
jgi:hypothetical protein